MLTAVIRSRFVIVFAILLLSQLPAAAQNPTPTPTVGPPPVILVNGNASSITVVPGAIVTVSVSDGPGNPTDWLAKYSASAGNQTYYPDYIYLSGTKTPPQTGLSSGSFPFTMPTATGAYNFRLLLTNSFTSVATSPIVTVAIPPTPTRTPTPIPTPTATRTPTPIPGPPPVILVNGSSSSITVAPGSVVTVSVSGGPANARDWLAKYSAAAGNQAYYPDYLYFSGTQTPPETGLPSGDFSFTMPTTLGTYNFRLLLDNSFTVAATSPTVAVAVPPTPTPIPTSTPTAAPTATPTATATATPTPTPTPGVKIVSPPPSQSLFDVRPTLRIDYGGALDLATLVIKVNGENWTSRFTLAQGSASYAVSEADMLVAGSLTIEASAREEGASGSTFSDSQTYEVFPTFTSVAPAVGYPTDQLTISGKGLDPDLADNIVRFTSTAGTTMDVPFNAVSPGTGTGSTVVPEDADSGPLRLFVNGKQAREQPQFTVPPAFPMCGGYSDMVTLRNGLVIVYYQAYNLIGLPLPPRCPPISNFNRSAIVAWAGSGQFGGIVKYCDGVECPILLAVDKTAEQYAVVSFHYTNELYDGLLIDYKGKRVTIPGHVDDPRGYSAAEFDRYGNLYLAQTVLTGSHGTSARARIVRVRKATLDRGGESALEPFMEDVDPSTNGVVTTRLKIGCDDMAYLGVLRRGPGDFPDPHGEFRTKKISLKDRVVIGQIDLPGDGPPGIRFSINYPWHPKFALTSTPGQLVGVSIIEGGWATRAWKIDSDGHTTMYGSGVSTLDFNLPPAINPAGSVLVGRSRTITTEAGIIRSALAPGAVVPRDVDGVSTAQCICPKELQILPTTAATGPRTTRWRPQRDTNKPIKFVFKGPTDLDPSTVQLKVTPPPTYTGPAYVPSLGDVTKVSLTNDEYEVLWSGPWKDANDRYLPAGNYTATLSGQRVGSDEILESNAYDKISLVEVKAVDLCQDDDGQDVCAPLRTHYDGVSADNPAVPLHSEEPTSNRVPRPGGGLRIFAEAKIIGELAKNIIKVMVTIDPVVPEDVQVSLRMVDVDDPDGPPIDKDGDAPETPPADNHGAAFFRPSVRVPAGQAKARVNFIASQNPGDNYRIAASTSGEWLTSVTAHQPSLTGEVWDEQGSTLPESTSDDRPAQLSKMITVWRTLNLEIDSMEPPPTDSEHVERNFITGQVTQIQGYNFPIRMIVAPNSPPEMDQLRDKSNDCGNEGVNCDLEPFGRFESGTITLGDGAGALALNVHSNGPDYINGVFVIPYQMLSLNDAVLSAGRVLDADLLAGTFTLVPQQGSWTAAQNEAIVLTIAGVRWAIMAIDQTHLDAFGNIVGLVVVSPRVLKFRLVDDDQKSPQMDVNQRVLQDSDSPEANAFAAAYIRPRLIPPSMNVRKHSPFNRNQECAPFLDGCTSARAEDSIRAARDVATYTNYWVGYALAGFQPGAREDLDPRPDDLRPFDDPLNEKLIMGRNFGLNARVGAVIYTEAIREVPHDRGFLACLETTPPHELGHQFGIDDETDTRGIMAPGCEQIGRYFAAESVKKIRENGLIP
jgi:hypothetical protein